MAKENLPPPHRPPRFIRIIKARPRLFIAAIIGIVVIALLPADWLMATRLLIGWDICVVIYMIAVYKLFGMGGVAFIRRRAAIEDEGRFGVLILTAAASLASLGAIIALLGHTHGSEHDPKQLMFATLTILLSWCFIHTIFALHYANEFYSAKSAKMIGMTFPNDNEPDYWDFLYFSFVIGMTAQVSDVAVASKAVRRTVLAHGIVSFLFNAALLALVVNIAASAI
jgi:uncharacterized membrane protein